MKKIYVIAEMAYSHDGSVKLAKQIVDDAIYANADAISIHLTSVPDYISIYYKTGKGRVSAGKEDKPFYNYLDQISLSFDEWKDIIQYIRRKSKLDILIMPNDTPSLEFAHELNPSAYVVPTSNFEEHSFIREIGNREKPVYLRVGGASLGEIETAINILNTTNTGQVTLLYGHQNYPTVIEDTNLGFIPYLQSAFGLPVGIADHVDGEDKFAAIVPLLSIPLGVTCIEKHITYDRSKKGEDFEAALNRDEFKEMVENIKKAQLALKDKGLLKFTKDTDFYRENLRKRVVASRDLKAGEVMSDDMAEKKRSDDGIFPSELKSVLGLTLQNDISKDKGIKIDYFYSRGKK